MSREDLTAIVKEEIATAAGYLGVHPTTASDLAQQVEDRIRLRIGGSEVRYVAKRDRVERDRKIRAEFNGNNLEEVARNNGVSSRQARRIVWAAR